MARTTKKQVEGTFKTLADALGHPTENLWTMGKKSNKSTIGGWVLDHNGIYGGYVIEEIVTDGGGTTHPFGPTRRPAGAMWEFLHSMLTGLAHKSIGKGA